MADPTQVTQSQIGFAPEVAPYAQDILGRAQAMATQTPYQPYTGEQVAQFSPLQQQSYDYAQQMTTSPQLQDATALAGQAGLGALNTQYTFKPSDFTADAAKNLMSPYMQNVVDVQQQQAKRQAAIAQQGLQAQAANAGAFGGGRQAIMNAQANAELQRNLQGIQATGLQNAYQQAQQQYNTQQQQNAQQQQFGASLGMQGLGLANQAASNLGALGQTQYAQNVGLVGLQNQLGLQQQQQAQNVLNTQYQNYLNEQNDPYKKLGFYSDIVRGAPLMQTGSAVYQQAPSAIQNLTSLGLGAYGLSSLFGGSGTGQAGKAEGGAIKGYAYGGSVLSNGFKEYAVDHIDPRQLPIAQRNAAMRGDIQTAQDAQEQMAIDAALRRGVASALPPGANVVRAAGGGILAFAGNEDDNDAQTGQMISDEATPQGAPNPKYVAGAQGAINRLMDTQGQIVTPEQQLELTRKFYKQEEEQAGPNTAAEQFQSYLDETKAGLSRALEEGKGIAALKAAQAVLQPGGTMRGLGAAGAAFGEAYGDALKADRAQKEHLAKAQFMLADAKRKERMGFTKSAQASTAAHVKQIQEANKQEVLKNKYIADASVQLAKATRGAAGAGAGGKEFMVGPAKLEPQIRAENPGQSDDWYKAEAYRQYKRLAPGVPGAEIRAETTEQTEAGKRFDQALLMRQAEIRKAQKAGDTDRVNQIRAEVAAESGFKLPKTSAAASQTGGAGVTVSAGGKSYTFPDQASADKFKAAAGIK